MVNLRHKNKPEIIKKIGLILSIIEILLFNVL